MKPLFATALALALLLSYGCSSESKRDETPAFQTLQLFNKSVRIESGATLTSGVGCSIAVGSWITAEDPTCNSAEFKTLFPAAPEDGEIKSTNGKVNISFKVVKRVSGKNPEVVEIGGTNHYCKILTGGFYSNDGTVLSNSLNYGHTFLVSEDINTIANLQAASVKALHFPEGDASTCQAIFGR